MFTDAQDAPTTCVGADRRPIPVGEPDEVTEYVGARPAGGPLHRVTCAYQKPHPHRPSDRSPRPGAGKREPA